MEIRGLCRGTATQVATLGVAGLVRRVQRAYYNCDQHQAHCYASVGEVGGGRPRQEQADAWTVTEGFAVGTPPERRRERPLTLRSQLDAGWPRRRTPMVSSAYTRVGMLDVCTSYGGRNVAVLAMEIFKYFAATGSSNQQESRRMCLVK